MTQNTGTSASASSPASEYSGFIFLKTDWFDLCCPRDSQESSPAPQFEGINSLAFCHSSTVQLSQPFMITGKILALTIWTFVIRVMFLLFNTLSRLIIAFLPRSSHLLISSLQSPSAVILDPKKRKSVTNFHLFPFYLPCSNGAFSAS